MSTPEKGARTLTWALLGLLALVVVIGAVAVASYMLARSRAPSIPSPHRDVVAEVSALPDRWHDTKAVEPITLAKWIPAHMSAVFSVAVSPSGDRVASASNDGTVKIWDLKTYDPIRALPGHTARVGSIAWSPDGTWVASAGDTRVLVQDAATGATKLTLVGEGGVLTSVDVSHDGKWITAGSVDGSIHVWSVENGSLRTKIASASRVLTTKFSPDLRLIATGGDDTKVKLWDAATGASRGVLSGHERAVNSVEWAPDSHILASVSDDHTVRLWLPENSLLLRTANEATDEVWGVSIDPRGKWIATVGKEGIIRLYDAATLRLTRQRTIEKHGALSVSWAPDGKTFVSGLGAGALAVMSTDFATNKDNVPPIPVNPRAPRVAKTPAEVPFVKAMALIDSYDGIDTPLDEADSILHEALKTDPKNALAYVGLSRVISRRLDAQTEMSPALLDEAEKLAQRGLDLAPNSPDAHYRRAWLYYSRHDDAHAREEALLAQKLGADPRSLLADLALRSEDDDNAERIALSAIPQETLTGLAWPYHVLHNVYGHRHDYAAADVAYQRLLALRPASAWTKSNYAGFLTTTEQYDRAIDFARQALAIMNFPAAHHIVALAFTELGAARLWGTGPVDYARNMFENAILESPTYARAHYGLGAYYRKRAITEKNADFLRQSSAEFDLAIKADRDFELAKRARADNDRVPALPSVSKR